MSHHGFLRGSVAPAAALAVTMTASGAYANLSAEEVWEAWQAYSAISGGVTDATLTRDGTTLTATDVVITSDADELVVSARVDRIDLTEQPDGTVTVTMSDSYVMEATGEFGQRLVAEIRQPGMRLTVSASDTGLNHAIAAPEIEVTLTELSGPDIPDTFDMSLNAVGIAGFYDIPRDPGGPFSSHISLGAANGRVDVRDGNDVVDLDYSATGLRLSFGASGLDQMGMIEAGDMGGALAAGFGLQFGFAYDTVRYGFEVVEWGERNAASGSAMSGESRFVLDSTELSFRSSSRNSELSVSGSEIPLPEVGMSAGQIAYGVTLPTAGSPVPQDIDFLVRLVDVVLPDDVWAMADPSGELARGPATVILDLVGSVLLPADLFSMETMFGYMMGGPMEAAQPVSLDVRELLVRAAGAELTGSGSFTFDPDDLDTFDGLPRPEGTLDLALSGGNALLDTLVNMGLLPEDQAMAARMVMALFARPGDGPDQLLSTIEVQEGGAIFANGMRIQ